MKFSPWSANVRIVKALGDEYFAFFPRIIYIHHEYFLYNFLSFLYISLKCTISQAEHPISYLFLLPPSKLLKTFIHKFQDV